MSHREDFVKALRRAVHHRVSCSPSQDGYSACSCGADAARATVLRLYDEKPATPSSPVEPSVVTNEDVARAEKVFNSGPDGTLPQDLRRVLEDFASRLSIGGIERERP